MTAFDPLTTPVDKVRIGRRASVLVETPGLARILGADQIIVWDEQQGYGASGAFLIGRGAKLVHFTLELRFFKSAHWVAWDSFRQLVQRPPIGQRGSPLTISHPWLVMQDVKQCVVSKCGQPELSDEMLGTVKIEMIEYRVPRLTLSKPTGEAAAPLDWWDQQIKNNGQTIDQQNQALAK